MSERRRKHNLGGRGPLGVVPLVLGLTGCPQLIQDDFGTTTPLPALSVNGEPDASVKTLDGPPPTLSLDAGAEPESVVSADADVSVPADPANADAAGTEQPLELSDAAAPTPDAAPPVCVPSPEVCDGRDNDCDDLVDEAPACPVSCTGLLLQGHGAMFCGGAGVVFATADTRCGAQGMHLVRLNSLAQNTAVVQAAEPLYSSLSTLVEEQDALWTDARDGVTEGTWRWGQAGTVFWSGAAAGTAQNGSYVNWGTGKPNNNGSGTGEDCGVLYIGSGTETLGTWNDHTCDALHNFLCEADQ